MHVGVNDARAVFAWNERRAARVKLSWGVLLGDITINTQFVKTPNCFVGQSHDKCQPVRQRARVRNHVVISKKKSSYELADLVEIWYG